MAWGKALPLSFWAAVSVHQGELPSSGQRRKRGPTTNGCWSLSVQEECVVVGEAGRSLCPAARALGFNGTVCLLGWLFEEELMEMVRWGPPHSPS